MSGTKEGQVAPEVQAAQQKLRHYTEGLLVTIRETELDPKIYMELLRLDAEEVQTWVGVIRSEDVPKAFWSEVLKDLNFWHEHAVSYLEKLEILEAIECVRAALGSLIEYAKLLGLEVPPEEEEKVEEQLPEGTLLDELGLSNRVSNVLFRGFGRWEPDKKKTLLFVEDVLAVLGDLSSRQVKVRGFGPKALEELLTALREKGFLPTEEAAEGE